MKGAVGYLATKFYTICLLNEFSKTYMSSYNQMESREHTCDLLFRPTYVYWAYSNGQN